MRTEERNLHFTLLDTKEKKLRLDRLSSSGELVTVWVKGVPQKELFSVSSLEMHSLSLILNIPSAGCLTADGDVLYSFSIRGVSYFGKGQFVKKGIHAFLNTKNDLFKCERRGDFRLNTYPHHQIYTNLIIRDEYKGSESKVVSINSGVVSDTQLFRDFLKFTGQHNKNGEISTRLRVFDISASGLGLLVGDLEKEAFKKGTILNNLQITFDNTLINVSEALVVYCVDAIASNTKTKQFKIGIEFVKVNEQTEKLLREKINESLTQSEVEKDFEEFIE